MSRNKTRSKKDEIATMSLPIGPELVNDSRYQKRHLNVQLSPPQAVIMQRLIDGCQARGLVLPDGKPVYTASGVIRYLLETVNIHN